MELPRIRSFSRNKKEECSLPLFDLRIHICPFEGRLCPPNPSRRPSKSAIDKIQLHAAFLRVHNFPSILILVRSSFLRVWISQSRIPLHICAVSPTEGVPLVLVFGIQSYIRACLVGKISVDRMKRKKSLDPQMVSNANQKLTDVDTERTFCICIDVDADVNWLFRRSAFASVSM
ncbi:hypothetical protein B296_00037464 [Ensete ventricosum]|uniref:Uncharacterized protein n=1 Tax=Ensete ventricosum TaxID=4639 RepID=A0A426Z748_ENSVE|nr:hypothetical protein B296_00037464 [Ensete ventricosum]